MKTFHGAMLALFVAVVFLLLASAAFSITLVPTGLSPGDKYHLAFVTSTQRDATSSNIDDYNAFVNDAADLGGIGPTNWSNSPIGPINWKAIGSTATINAKNNALVSAPVYRLDDTLVATGFADMWDQGLQNSISIDEAGNVKDVKVWTGSDGLGWAYPDWGLGSEVDYAVIGWSIHSNNSWICHELDYLAMVHPFYSLSEELTVGEAPIPEPGTLVLFGIGMLGVLGYGFMRNRRKKSSV